MNLVLIPTKLDPIARQTLEERGFCVVQDTDTDLMELARRHPEAGAMIVRSDRVTPEAIDLLPRLKLIVRAGSGTNTIDTKYARRKGIDVMNTPGANANAVAEEVICLLLAHYRHVVEGDRTTRAGEWEKQRLMGRELTGKTVGIVGLGNIGQLVATRLSGFEVRLLGYDPVVSEERAGEVGVRTVSLETVFRESDVVTLHVPETAETIRMVDAELLSSMKPDAVLINCARSGIVDEAALREVKAEKGLGFCTDVYPKDAPGPKSCANVADIMLPHLGASTHEANRNAAVRAAEQLIAYVERGVTKHVVNKGVPDGLDEAYQQLAYDIACTARNYLGTQEPVRRIECSFYGGLAEFAKWLIPPIAAGISADFDALQDLDCAEEYLSGKGITIQVRTPDESKGYGRALTVDVLQGRESLRQVSIRGTIAEGNIVISRINDFERLYFLPKGNSLIVEYLDRPGVLARITAACGDCNINIEDIRAPRDATAKWAMAVLKTDQRVSPEVVAQLRAETDARVAFAMSLP